MIQTLTGWELLLLGAFVLIMGEELVTLLVARRKGVTRNVSRVATYSSLIVLAAIYTLHELQWLRFDEAAGGMQPLRHLPTANWGFLVLGVMCAVVAGYGSTLIRARIAGLTRTVSRLVALAIAVVLLLVLLGISQVKWNLYLERLEAVYSESLSRS